MRDDDNMTGYYEEYPELDQEAEEDTAPGDERPVASTPRDWTISALREKYERGQIILQPSFQREYVWSRRPGLAPRLIESVLLHIPIPPMYFGTLPGGKMDVIDGQQRLTTLISFVTNGLKLEKLQRLTSLNGKYFRDLSEEQQAQILDAPIHSIVIDTGNNHTLRYDVFERLNRGSVPLNEQELRNCVYRGPFPDLLVELEKDATWRRVKGGDTPEPRFVEREIILRFFAFTNRINYYSGNLKKFLNDYIALHAPKDSAQLQESRLLFQQTMKNVYTVFGERSGRLYTAGSDERPTHDGNWESKFTVSAFDIQASALLNQSPAAVQAMADQIREAYIFYLLSNRSVRPAIAASQGSASAARTRWHGFQVEVQNLLSSTPMEPRFFPRDLRRRLYDANHLCRLCGNVIHSFEDSAVDHIHPYSKGGKTVLENAQLAHRSCNARKCAKESEQRDTLPAVVTVTSQGETLLIHEVTHVPLPTVSRSTGEIYSRPPASVRQQVGLGRGDVTLVNSVPIGITLCGQQHTVTAWKSILLLVVETMLARHSSDFEQCLQIRGAQRPYFSRDPRELGRAAPINGSTIYVEVNFNADRTIGLCRRVLATFGHQQSDLEIHTTGGSQH